MKKIRIIKHRVAALLMSLVIALGCFSPAFSFKAKAEAATVLNGTATIADIIVTYCVGSGAAITNTTVLGNLYNTVGNSFGTIADFVDDGLLVVDAFGNYIDNGLGNAINSVDWSQVGLNVGNLFSATEEQVAAGSAVGLTAGANLASSAGSLAAGGLIGTVATAGGAVVAGIALGLLANHIYENYLENIIFGVKVNTTDDILDHAYAGGTVVGVYNNEFIYCFASNNLPLVYNGTLYIATKNGYVSYRMKYNNSWSSSNSSYSSNPVSWGGYGNGNGAYACSSQSELNKLSSDFRNGTLSLKKYSPDIIGSNGNQTAQYNDGEYTLPYVQPQYNPESHGMSPIPQNNYMNFANSANTNTGSNINPSTDNALLFNTLLGEYTLPYTQLIPEPEPNPDPNPAPDPETVPVPDLNPYPDNYPVAVPEDVPADKPQPDYTEKQTENETDITEGDPYTTPNLLNKFPFCIPRDILQIFQKLNSGSREAPHIVWRFNPNSMIDHTFDIDFSMFNNVASLLRLLELLSFIVALGIATRNLILS